MARKSASKRRASKKKTSRTAYPRGYHGDVKKGDRLKFYCAGGKPVRATVQGVRKTKNGRFQAWAKPDTCDYKVYQFVSNGWFSYKR